MTLSVASGSKPIGRLILGSDGNLWGTASAGGTGVAPGDGTVFKVPVGGGAVTKVFDFAGGANGRVPKARLLLASDGSYYGTASAGGGSSKGTVYKLSAAGTLLGSWDFTGANGATPEAALVESSGFLWGTTKLGGSKNKGVIYKVPLGGNTPVLVASFTGANGANPVGAVLKVGSDFWGTASKGGASNKGVIYKLALGTGPLTAEYSFSGTDGSSPETTLIQPGGAGTELFGTTSAGGAGLPLPKGTIFKFQP